MFQKDYTTERRKFKHLTKEKRAQIEILLKHNISKIQIANDCQVCRSKSEQSISWRLRII